DATAILKRIDALVRLLEDDQRLKNSFVAQIATEYYDAEWVKDNGPINANGVLGLTPPAPLLSLTSLSVNDSEDPDTFTAIEADNILLLPRGNVPKTQIKLLNSEQWPFSTTNREGAIKITGEWGFHDDPANRWLDSNDTLQANINTSANSVLVSDADGTDYWLDTPRFSPGNVIKIDSEYMAVRATSTDNGTLTVMRGQRGSTRAAHTATATIYNWSGVQAAQDFVTRAAALQYKRRGEFIDTKVEGVTEVHWPTAQTIPEYKALLHVHNMGRILSG
ncbi:MAG: hypothetical protein KAJ19_13755, partial [Gammaproteobacteria bacterium]|nr:hypothetical protein [Gammaproteobacteria bacterium]